MIIRIVIAITGVAVASWAQNTGSIIGAVTDQNGNAVAGALVMAALKPPSTAQAGGSAPVVLYGSSGPTGAFEIDALPAGTYKLCMEKPGSQLLNPCIWSSSPVTASVTAGGKTSGVSVVAVSGATVTVRVADANGILASNPRANDLLIGVGHGTSPFIPARVVATDSGGRTFGIVVPAGSPINLSVYSSALALADQTGAAFGTNAVSIPLSAGQTAASTASAGTPTVTLQITGLATAKPATGSTGATGASGPSVGTQQRRVAK